MNDKRVIKNDYTHTWLRQIDNNPKSNSCEMKDVEQEGAMSQCK